MHERVIFASATLGVGHVGQGVQLEPPSSFTKRISIQKISNFQNDFQNIQKLFGVFELFAGRQNALNVGLDVVQLGVKLHFVSPT
jgi:hypothetical protein